MRGDSKVESSEYGNTLAKMYTDGCSHKEMVNMTMKMFPEITETKAYNKMRTKLHTLSKNGLIQMRPNGYRPGMKSTNDELETETSQVGKQSMSFNAKDNSTTYEAVINVPHDKPLTPELVMKAHNLESALWEVMSYTSNLWQQQTKNENKIDLYQTKITVRPRKQIELSISDIDEYFKHSKAFIPKQEIKPVRYTTDGDTLVIKVPDLHIGLLAWADECGNNYDLKIAKKNFLYCISDVADRCKYKDIKQIVFATLGDILHVDNNLQQTSHGTFQQTDGRLGKIIEAAETMMIEALSMLEPIAPIKYVYVSGNHDSLSGYLFAKLMETRYRMDKNIEFDVKPNPIKHVIIGKTLIIFHHGDAPTKNIEQAAYNFCKEQILSDIKWVEMNVGHLHDQFYYTKDGITIRHMPALCNSSYWEHQQLYKGDDRCVVCDIYNDEHGRRETWQSNL